MVLNKPETMPIKPVTGRR